MSRRTPERITVWVMNASGPWWAGPLFALVGSFGAVLVSLLVTGRRESRSRFADQKRAIYADFLAACGELVDLEVWPSSGLRVEPGPVVGRIRDASMHTVLVAHGAVAARVAEAVASASQLAAVVTTIRESSKPGHSGQIDERQRPAYDEARAKVRATLNDFVESARLDINVRTPFEPVFPGSR